ncbi:uncharacterized protein LOC111705999 isoform X2 [Eurytemora carolleeae]|uniref:uncharacterized protein LOC111705999 isoform X2 n=1 Tax=Eurytemora carolleeae TaxID=1294199 RepID=UPI000C769097|nr:uncharacterized protein LOC111705999 isoform X2 [Eurytemora carolleeae]|eukprot:XP_023334500.1 uncharacterized protein LOC111705999 isoform X2 [Eurytemora affinis]
MFLSSWRVHKMRSKVYDQISSFLGYWSPDKENKMYPWTPEPSKVSDFDNFNPLKEKLGIQQESTKKKVGWAKKIQFILIFLVSFAILIVQGRQCVENYLKKLTSTGDTYAHVATLPFPELTICPTYPYKLDVLQANGIPSQSAIQFNSNWISNISFISPKQLYESTLIKIEEILVQLRLDLEGSFNGSSIMFIKPNQLVCGKQVFRATEYYYNGRCYTMELPDCILRLGVLEVNIDFIDKTDIFIHHEGQFLSPDSRSRVDVDKGSFVKIAINHEVVQLLPDVGTCVAGYGPNLTDSYDDCIFSNLYDLMIQNVGCAVPFLPNVINICVEENQRQQAFNIYQENRRNQKNICANPCTFTNMYFGPPVTGKSQIELADIGRAVFYYRRSVKYTEEYVRYTWLSMVAELGGYTGLLLGYSLLHLSKIFDPILECFGAIYEKTKQRTTAQVISVRY